MAVLWALLGTLGAVLELKRSDGAASRIEFGVGPGGAESTLAESETQTLDEGIVNGVANTGQPLLSHGNCIHRFELLPRWNHPGKLSRRPGIVNMESLGGTETLDGLLVGGQLLVHSCDGFDCRLVAIIISVVRTSCLRLFKTIIRIRIVSQLLGCELRLRRDGLATR